jgi:predicted methyltransferase
VSRATELPVPIVASICGELRKRSVVADERPAQLTSAGRALFGSGGLTIPRGNGARGGLSDDLRPLLRSVSRLATKAPAPRLELDQCHCTVETKVRRVLALHEADALVGRRVLLLGDDDLTALTIERLVDRFGSPESIAQLTVLDVDPRLVEFVRDALAGAPFPWSCVVHDLRRPLPPELHDAFDTVVTDPPYTVAAARLFLSRAADALAEAGDVFFSFGSRRPEAAYLVQQAMAEMGFVIRSLARDFNEYVGAGVIGGTSHLYHLSATRETRALVDGLFVGPLYTADR